MTPSPRAILFDLDGTLLDTAPDLVYALNKLREEHNLPVLPLSIIRPIISLGSRAMIRAILSIDETDPTFETKRERFLTLYQDHIANATRLFPGTEEVLAHLEAHEIPWGIVTNKLTQPTHALLKALRLDHRPQCVICGDTLPTHKPDPAPIQHACALLDEQPQDCIYVGDSMTDVMASKAAGTRSLVVMYGYIGPEDDPLRWEADGYLHQPQELLDWL